jgi:hypothetical protein
MRDGMPHRFRRLPVVAVAAAAAALILPASALARSTLVVPFKTVAGLPLKQTPAYYVKRLGQPSHTIRVSGKVAEYEYAKLNLDIQFDTIQPHDPADFVGVAQGVFTSKIPYHASDGVKLGDTEAQVKAKLGSACKIKEGGCQIWKGTPGAVGSYSFNLQFEQGKLTEIDNQYDFE